MKPLCAADNGGCNGAAYKSGNYDYDNAQQGTDKELHVISHICIMEKFVLA
jgi:hypothetical protein